MKIDRHNYEEYFLLYVDDELAVDQKKQVELFVKENPDLEEELIMLQQSKLVPETIVFDEKHLLRKEENNSFINLNNYEEWLVLYVDNELSGEEKITVEKFVAAHPHVQAELSLFQRTKLQPESFSFPHKNLLYRNKERARVITMTWWRVAVAAVLILVAGVTLYSVLNKKNSIRPEDKIASKGQMQSPAKPALPDQQPKQDNRSSNEDQIAIAVPKEKAKQKENKNQEKNILSPSNNQIARVIDQQNVPQKRPVIVSEINTVQPKDLQIADVKDPVRNKQIINEVTSDPDVTKPSSETPDDYASNNENKKLRGLFRKATRFIERTSGINPANDDNRVLIGGMAINLK